MWGGLTFRDAMDLKKIKVHSRKPERRRSGVQSKEAGHVEVEQEPSPRDRFFKQN